MACKIRARGALIDSSELPRLAAQLGPWWFRFERDGVPFGGSIPRETQKTEWFFRCVEELGGERIHSILELGSHEGSHSLQLAAHPSVEHVVGLEGQKGNLARARFVKQVFGDRKIDFRECNLEHLEPAGFDGSVDAVFCAGLLYHLPAPWQLVRRLPSLTPKYLFLDTHYAAVADATAEGYSGWWYTEGKTPASGLSPASFWLSFPDLMVLLMENGFLVRFIHDMKEFPRGPRAFVFAERAAGVGASRGGPVSPVGGKAK